MEQFYREIELLLSIDENTNQTVKNIELAKKELQTSFDSLHDIILLLDENGAIIRTNHAVFQWNLLSPEKLMGQPFHRLFHPGCIEEKCHMGTYWALACQKLRHNESFEYQLYDNQLGRYLLIQFRPIATEVTDPNLPNQYHKNFAVAVFKDITKNRQAELQLDQTTEELRTIFQALPDQYIRLNWNGSILDVHMNVNSDASILPHDSIGKKITDYFAPDTAARFQEAIHSVLRTGTLVIVDFSMHMGNTEQFFESRLLPLGKDNIIAINRNITQSKRLESIAESIDFMKNLGYIFSGIRHEIGNPINAIKMTMSVLKKNIGIFSLDKIREYTERVLTEIHRVEYLLKSFKSFNMFENLRIDAIDITTFLNYFLILVEADFKNEGIAIHLNPHHGERTFRADPRALHQVLLNIMGNAADALKDIQSPRIEISTSRIYGKMLMVIKDNGHGITDKEMHNIFKPFYTTKPEGTGLGLVIVRKILSRMQSDISIKSVENKGTVITLTLPG